MGCGISRINLMEEGMACGLKRRIVQVRSRNDLLAAHHVDPGTASTKMLLKESNNREDADSHNSLDDHVHRNNIVSDRAAIKEPPVQQQIREKNQSAHDDDHQKRLEKVRLANNICESPLLTKKSMGSSQDCEEHGDDQKEKYETDDDDDQLYEEEDGRRISNCTDGATLIGSPSFREYCVDYESDHGADDHSSNGGNKEHRMQGMDINLICNDEEEGINKKKQDHEVEKKGSRSSSGGAAGNKLRKVFPMHKSTRHLWNVTACYSRNNHHVV